MSPNDENRLEIVCQGGRGLANIRGVTNTAIGHRRGRLRTDTSADVYPVRSIQSDTVSKVGSLVCSSISPDISNVAVQRSILRSGIIDFCRGSGGSGDFICSCS